MTIINKRLNDSREQLKRSIKNKVEDIRRSGHIRIDEENPLEE